MFHDKRSALSSYVSSLLASGRMVFTAEEAERALGVGRGAFLDAAERLQRRKALLRPRQGFYVVVPPQYASWGAPPPAWYIDALMRREGQAYYVGLLKAAELHGATHQAVMEFQVISNKRLPRIRAGRNLIVFYFRKEMEAVTAGIEGRKTDTGTMKISSAALTALDLLRYPQASAESTMSPRSSRTSDGESIPSNSPPFRGWWSGRSCNVSGICWSVSAMTL